MTPSVADYCKITQAGIKHLFFGVGTICACGREMLAFALDTEELTLHEVPQEPRWSTALARCAGKHAPVLGMSWRIDLLLEHGASVIRRARQAWTVAQSMLPRRAYVRFESLRMRSERAIRSARGTRREVVAARTRRLASACSATSGRLARGGDVTASVPVDLELPGVEAPLMQPQ